MRITRAVRRGEALTDSLEARLALERVAYERRGARRARRGYLALAALALAGVVAGLLGPSALFLFSAVVLQSTLVARFLFLPRLERNLDQAEALNRAVVGRP
jgi:Flp pilus assembly protein TadB